MVLPSLHNEAVVTQVLHQLNVEDKHCVTRLVANDPVEAVLVLLTTHRGKAKELLEVMSGVIFTTACSKIVRQVSPDFPAITAVAPETRNPPRRVTQLYQPFIPPPPEQRVDAKGNAIEIPICEKCNGRGYFGRVAIFELLELTPESSRRFSNMPRPRMRFGSSRGSRGT